MNYIHNVNSLIIIILIITKYFFPSFVIPPRYIEFKLTHAGNYEELKNLLEKPNQICQNSFTAYLRKCEIRGLDQSTLYRVTAELLVRSVQINIIGRLDKKIVGSSMYISYKGNMSSSIPGVKGEFQSDIIIKQIIKTKLLEFNFKINVGMLGYIIPHPILIRRIKSEVVNVLETFKIL